VNIHITFVTLIFKKDENILKYNIYIINMEELNKKIKLIFLDKNLSQEEKNKKIQELYSNNLKEKKEIIDCEHYERKCDLLSPCCNKWVPCRFCHDDNDLCESKFDRFNVSKIRCIECKEEQEVSNKCKKCEIKFAESFCGICKVWTKDKIWHCNDCGFCRIGEELYHCKLCDKCWLSEDHPCVKKLLSRDEKCPVCLESSFHSKKTTHVMNCGHQIHSECFNENLKKNIYQCPICKKSAIDMTNTWQRIKIEKNNTPMPDEYKDMKVKVACFDCLKESETEFHIVGLECKHCGSFNTQKL
jgi:RING finger and CHY zinc finger domain-containing protein 1